MRLLQFRSESKPDDGSEDEQLQTLAEITTEFLSDICLLISKVSKQSRHVSVVMVRTAVDGVFRASQQLFVKYVCLFQTVQETVADSVEKGYLTENTSLTAAANLLPNFNTSVSTKLKKKTVNSRKMCKLVNNGAL